MKKRIIILGAIVLVLVLGWSGAWYFFAGQLRQQVEALAMADGETAPQLTCQNLVVGGFPFRFDVQWLGVAVVSADTLVELPELRASAMAYRPNHILATAIGPAGISDAFTGLRQSVSWTEIDASFRLENWRIARVSIVGDDLFWNDTLFGDTLLASAPHMELHLLDMPEIHEAEAGRAGLALFALAREVNAPSIELAAANAELEAEISGLPDDIRNWGLVPFLPDWQQAGGALRLVGLRANDASSDFEASGDLALDAQGYVTGAISVDSLGLAERIGPLIEQPWRTMILGMPGEDGRYRNQLTFAGGGVSAGLVPISAIPSLF